MYSNNESGGNALSLYTVILSVVYLTTHLEPHVIQRQMAGRPVANKLEMVWREKFLSLFDVLPLAQHVGRVRKLNTLESRQSVSLS
jgi:hypothetical protein